MTEEERREKVFDSICSMVYKLDKPYEKQMAEIEYYDPIIKMVVRYIDKLYQEPLDKT